MRDVQDGHAAGAQVSNDGADAFPTLHVEHGAWFVEQEDVGFHSKGAGNGDALDLAAGKVAGIASGAVFHADRGKGSVDAGGDLGLGDAQVLRTKGDVVRDDARHHLIFGVLEHAGGAAADLERPPGLARVDARHVHGAARGGAPKR